MNDGAAIAPEASAPTIAVLDPLVENTPLAPLAGALNVTGIPAAALVTGQPSPLLSATCKTVAKAVPSVAVCGVPATSVSWFGGLDDGHDAPVPVGDVPASPCGPPGSPEAKAGAPAVVPAQTPGPAAMRSASAVRRPPWCSQSHAARVTHRSQAHAARATAARRPAGRPAPGAVIG